MALSVALSVAQWRERTALVPSLVPTEVPAYQACMGARVTPLLGLVSDRYTPCTDPIPALACPILEVLGGGRLLSSTCHLLLFSMIRKCACAFVRYVHAVNSVLSTSLIL